MSEDTDFEEEFRKLTAELAADDTLRVDDGYHLEKGKLCVALVLAPMDNADALEALLKLTGTPASVVKLDPWAAVWMEVSGESSDEDEMMGILTGQRQVPNPVDKVARVISKLSGYGSVAVISWLSENEGFEPGVSGLITAKRYIAGEAEADLPAGLLMNSLDNKAEDLLLGRTRPEDYGDESGGWKRFFRPRGDS